MKKTEVIIVLLIILIFLTTSTNALNFFEQPNATQGKDCWLQSGYPNRNHGTNPKLQIKGNDNRRTLIEFDLSLIPSNSIIESADLQLYLLNKGTTPQINTSIQRITHEWIEGTGNAQKTNDGATWNTYNGTSNWNTSGGDFDTYIWTITEVSSKDTWYSFDITNLVQSWINNTYKNYGIIIRDMITNSGEWKFASSDNTNSSAHPKINITYTIPDLTPPSTITNLINISQGLDFIYWTWTNPTEPDFLENIIYLDNINLINTSNNYYNATNLSEDTEYTIKIHTIDTNNNINNTDIINTAKTLKNSTEENNNGNSGGGSGGSSGGGGGEGPSTVIQSTQTIQSTPEASETKPSSNINLNEQKNKQTPKTQEAITTSAVKEPIIFNENFKHIITGIMMMILAVYIYRKQVKHL